MNIKNVAELRAAILELENRQQRDKQQVIERFQTLKESFTPLNLVKNMFSGGNETTGIAGNILNATVGLGVGLLSKKLLIGKSVGLIKTILGSAVEIGMAGLVAKNSGPIRSAGSRLFKNIFRSKSKESLN